MTDKLQIIAEHYGLEKQQVKLIEEMSELTQAIAKYRISLLEAKPNADPGQKQIDNFSSMVLMHNCFEEIADVEILLEQVKHLWQCEKDVEIWKDKKINRELERIKMN